MEQNNMKQGTEIEVNYLKIGSFVLAGIVLIILTILLFGSGKLFKNIVWVETYFNESVLGITEGSSVKYRGLQIGTVEEVAFVSEKYDVGRDLDALGMFRRFVYVKIALTSPLFTHLKESGLKQFLAEEINHGLRVKLVTQGLAGTSNLVFDYVDPKTDLPPKLGWQPKLFYIPSVPSALSRLSENAQYIMNELKDIDFKKTFINFGKLTDSLDNLVGKTNKLIDEVDSPISEILKNLGLILQDLKTASERIKLNPSVLLFSTYPSPINLNEL